MRWAFLGVIVAPSRGGAQRVNAPAAVASLPRQHPQIATGAPSTTVPPWRELVTGVATSGALPPKLPRGIVEWWAGQLRSCTSAR